MSRSDRMFRRLLGLFPAEFRADFGDDMAETFRDHREAMVNRGDGRSAFALWWHTIVGIVRTAPREHVAQLTTDVRYALRNLRRHPAFTFISILALAGTTLPRAESIVLDERTLLFTLALTLATPILFGILPALRATLQATFDALQEGGRADAT